MATIYYRYSDSGAVGTRASSSDAQLEPPEGAVVITESEYNAAVGEMSDAYDQLDEQAEAEQRANAEADYKALLDVGLPEATARRLSGYEPGDSPGDSPGQVI